MRITSNSGPVTAAGSNPISLWRGIRHQALAAAAAIAMSCAAIVFRVFESGPSQAAIVLVWPIVASAYIGGLWPGLLSTALVTVLAALFVSPPAHPVWFEPGSVGIRWISLAAVGAVVSILMDIYRRTREKARAGARQHAVTLGSIADGVVVADANSRVTFINPAAEAILGWTNEDAAGQPLQSVFALLDRQCALVGKTNARDFESASLDTRHGRRIPVEYSESPIGASQGPPSGSVTVFRDISERQRVMSALREGEERLRDALDESKNSEAKLKLALEASQMRVWTWDPEKNRVNYVKPHGDDEKREIVEIDAFDFLKHVHPEDQSLVYAVTERRLTESEPLSVDYRFIDPDGTVRWISNYGQTIFNEDGSAKLVIGTIRDITAQKQAERQLAESRARFESVVDSAMDAIISVGADRRIVLFNKAAERRFRCSAENAIGQPFDKFIPERPSGARAAVDAVLRGAAEARSVIGMSGDLVGLCADGTEFPFEASLSLNEAAGQNVLTIAIRDLSDHRRAENALKQIEASKRLESLGRMTGGIAHDFNNLLTVISGNLQLIEMEAPNARVRRFLAEAEKAVALGARLNTNLMTFARKRVLAPAATDINVEVRSMAEMLQRVLGETIAVRTVHADSPCVAFVDPTEVQSALLNLALNSFDAMPRGGHLVIETAIVAASTLPGEFEDASPETEYVRVSVTDDGAGMPPEVRARAFEPFFTTRDVGKGTGLGLATIHGFAKQSGGHVSIRSEPGQGTEVTIYFPRIVSASQTQPRAQSADSEISRSPGENILLVEDNEAVRRVTRERLTSLGYQVAEAATAAEALEAIEAQIPIDLVFSDIVMPGGMSGYDLASRILASNPSARILLTSGFNEEIARRQDEDVAHLPILRKPYSLSELSAALRDACANDGGGRARTNAHLQKIKGPRSAGL